jgi:hypothetical protein
MIVRCQPGPNHHLGADPEGSCPAAKPIGVGSGGLARVPDLRGLSICCWHATGRIWRRPGPSCSSAASPTGTGWETRAFRIPRARVGAL